MLLGLTQRTFEHNGQLYDGTDRAWSAMFQESDGYKLLPIANTKLFDLVKVCKKIDALIITGGNDIAPRGINEWKLIDIMSKLDKPVIGICHGAFLMTAKAHGTVEPTTNHKGTNHVIWYKGYERIVNSHHDIAIKRVPEGAEILCEADDGSVECWIKGKQAAIAWHPERLEDFWIPPEVNNLLC